MVAVSPPSARRALVTGGAGFVGADVVRRLLDDGHRLTLIVRPGNDLWRLQDVARQLEVVEVDLRDEEAVQAVVRSTRPEWAFHLPPTMRTGGSGTRARCSPPTSWPPWPWWRHVEPRGVKRSFMPVRLRSTASKTMPRWRASRWSPTANTRWPTLRPATAFCRYVAQRHGFNAVTLRLYSVYGPYEDPRRLIPTLISLGMRNQLPPLVSPDVARDFVAVEDVVDAFMLSAADPGIERGAIYNVGTGVQTTIRDAVDVTAGCSTWM